MDKRSIVKGIKNYLVDTTGLLATAMPLYAGVEVFGAGMSAATSLEARLKVAQLSYLGMGFIYSKGRDLSRRIFKVNGDSPELKKVVHDSIYQVVFNGIMGVPIYLSSGASLEEAIKGVTATSVLSLVSGPISGYGIDLFRNLCGTTNEFSRKPQLVNNLGKKAKRALAIALIMGTVVSMAGIYKIKEATTNHSNNIGIQQSALEIGVQSRDYTPNISLLEHPN